MGGARRSSPSWLDSAPVLVAAFAAACMIGILAYQNVQLRAALRAETAPANLAVGDSLPSAQLTPLDGSPRSIRQLLPSGGLLFFFTTTCRYCAASVPRITVLYDALEDTSAGLAGVSLDGSDAMREFVTSRAIEWPVFILDGSSRGDLLQIRRVPFTALISPSGEVLRTWTGEITDQRVTEISDKLMGRPFKGN